MKLKSKLFVTITSIVVAVVVMTIGVYAAASNYSVKVNNSVNLNFLMLSGDITVSAETGVDNSSNATPILNETTLYSNKEIFYSTISNATTSATKGADANLHFDGTEFFSDGYINNQTKAASVAYTFTYKPSANDSGVGSIAVMVEETKQPKISSAYMVTGYYVSTDNTNWTKLENKVPIVAGKDTDFVFVKAICQFLNPNSYSVSTINNAWNFTLSITTVSDTPAEQTQTYGMIDHITKGMIIDENGIPLDFIYEMSEDGNYVYFGQYPQTLKANDVSIVGQLSGDYYLGSDGAKYYKHTIDLTEVFDALGADEATATYLEMNLASTGEVMANGGTYYFKVEPIKWRILTPLNGKTLVVCDNILRQQYFQKSYEYDSTSFIYFTTANGAPEGTYANNYKYSQLRNFLVNDFYNSAFNSGQKNLILTTQVDNSASTTNDPTQNIYACENTSDKVFALSYQDFKNEDYGFTYVNDNFWEDPAKAFMTTDFAKATGALTYTAKWLANLFGTDAATVEAYTPFIGSGWAWSRSLFSGSSGIASNVICGSYGENNVYNAVGGCVPALQISL